MAFLGRFLQFVGWAWAAAGFFAPMAGVDGPPILIGLILVFLARAIRAQAARRAPAEEVDATTAPPAQPSPVEPVERPLNTERLRPVEVPEVPEAVVVHVEPEPDPSETRLHEPGEDGDLIDRIARTGRTAARTGTSGQRVESARHSAEPIRQAPMTSAEMIAAARKRWDNKPRARS